MKILGTNLRTIFILTAILVLLAGFDTLSAWTKPTAAPTGGNVAAPLNTGGAQQIKTGALGTGSLDVTGIQQITSPNPLIRFTDTDAFDHRIIVNGNNLYFQVDRDNNSTFSGTDAPANLTLFSGPTQANDHALFSNQVWANAYCDRSGNDCFQASDVTGGSTLVPGQAVYACPVTPISDGCPDTCKGQLQTVSTCVDMQISAGGGNSGQKCGNHAINCTPVGRLIQ